MSIKDRALGCFMGLAIGDALGASVEFEAPGFFEKVTDYRAGGPHNLSAGDWTDDTSMALALASSIIEAGWNPKDQLDKYLSWYQFGNYSVNGKCFDIGNTTQRALMKWQSQRNVDECGQRGEYDAGNGGIMRLAPVPICCRTTNLKKLSDWAEDSSRTTHANEMCLSAARYLALVISAFIDGNISKQEVLSKDWDLLNKFREIKPFHKSVENAIGDLFLLKPTDLSQGGFVIHTLHSAIWSFYVSDSFEDAVLRVINEIGGDTDTNGAVCGQLAGAYYGLSGIPDRLLDNLTSSGYLLGMAKGLVSYREVQ